MQPLRLLTRAVPKSCLRSTSTRCYSALSRNTVRPAWQASKKSSYPAFSTSTIRRDPAGDGDQLLAAKLEEEHRLETESVDKESAMAVESFKAEGSWTIIDKPGTNEITLQREYGNETIKVEFSIEDMTAVAEDEYPDMEDRDGALEDEDFTSAKRTINQSGTKGGIDVAPEDSIAPSDREADYRGDAPPRAEYPVHLDITVTKGNEKIEIRAVADDGLVHTDTIQYLNSEVDDDDSVTPYTGPPFTNLDGDLQNMFEQYLEERGINTDLVNTFQTLIEEKEQREYTSWLQKMQKFIEA